MLRLATVALVVLAGTTSFSHAADFTGTTCDSPKFEAYMMSQLGHGKLTGTNVNNPDRFNYGPILDATTIANTGNRISCRITVDLDTRKGTKPVRGVVTVTSGTPGHWGWSWNPGA